MSYGGGNSGIQVRNFNLVGSDPTPGYVQLGGQEGQHGILVDGGTNFEIDHNTFSAAFGDGVEVNSGASGVHIHDNTFTNTGRNGLSVIWGNHVEFDHNTLGHMGYMPFDVEPNTLQPAVELHLDPRQRDRLLERTPSSRSTAARPGPRSTTSRSRTTRRPASRS